MPHQDEDVRSSPDPQMSPPPSLLSPLYWQNPSNLFLLPTLKVLAENLQAQGAHVLLRAFTLPSPKQPVGKQILRYFSTRHKTFFCKRRYTICVCSVTQLFLTLCDPMDWSPPGILQARMLEWIAMPSSRGSSQPKDPTLLSSVFCIGRQILYHSHHLGSPLKFVGATE